MHPGGARAGVRNATRIRGPGGNNRVGARRRDRVGPLAWRDVPGRARPSRASSEPSWAGARVAAWI
ncbi:hypothetical protein GCM10010428_24110 [Actinosynnema pretiosum subsp. pretiosum]